MSKRNERLNKSKYGSMEYMAIIFCAVVGVAMIAIMIFFDNGKSNNPPDESGDYDLIELNPSEEQKSELTEDDNSQSEQGLPYEIIEINSDNVYKGDLILVNKSNPYSFKEETEIVNVYDFKNEKYKIGTGDEMLFEKTITSANEFLGDFYDISGVTNVTMVNGYISYEEQQKKYESYIKNATAEDAQNWGVKAGASDHHTGLSFNLTLYPVNGKIGEGEYAWITENAYRYGFIYRYPEEKADITSVKDNNHFRYVGIPHAEYIYKNNLTLEEYISELKKTSYSSPLKFDSGSNQYLIYYSPADSSSSTTEVKIPHGYEYSYSGDNVDGFIITAVLS